MAIVQVTTWADFLTAIAVSGDTVELPQGAEWDMNEIEPLGHADNIAIRCSRINGNGTRIKNLHLTGQFQVKGNYVDIYDLFLTDFIGDGVPDDGYGFFHGNPFFNRCGLSGIIGTQYRNLMYYTTNYDRYCASQTSINVESTSALFELYRQAYTKGCIYSRIEVHAPNATTNKPEGYDFRYCEVVVYAPNASSYIDANHYIGCTLRGNKSSITSDGASARCAVPTVYFEEMFGDGFTPAYPDSFIPCTDAQLKDPAYLRSLGFPIVVQ